MEYHVHSGVSECCNCTLFANTKVEHTCTIFAKVKVECLCALNRQGMGCACALILDDMYHLIEPVGVKRL